MQPELESQRNEGLRSICQSISSARSVLGVTIYPIDREKYLTYNSRVQPVARESEDLSLTDLSGQPSYIIGTEVSGQPSYIIGTEVSGQPSYVIGTEVSGQPSYVIGTELWIKLYVCVYVGWLNVLHRMHRLEYPEFNMGESSPPQF